MVYSGRASHRGGGKADTRPGATEELAAKMSSMKLSTDTPEDRQRRLQQRYGSALQSRPEHITTSQG